MPCQEHGVEVEAFQEESTENDDLVALRRESKVFPSEEREFTLVGLKQVTNKKSVM